MREKTFSGVKKMKWQKWIEQKGINNVAKELDVSREAVRRWLIGLCEPSKRNILRLVRLSKGDLTLNDFFEKSQ